MAVGLLLTEPPWPAGAQATPAKPAGSAVVVTPSGAVLSSGGSATVFTLKLPQGAACPGDTYHHGYLVFSYAVPVRTDPASLTFPGTFPSSGADLITVEGVPFVTQPTAEFTAAIQTLSDFSWSRYDHDPTDLPVGEYNVGIACAHGLGRVERFWNVKLDFTSTSSDPGGFVWRVLGAQSDPATPNSNHLGLAVIGLIVLVVVGLAVAVWLPSRRRRDAGSDSTGS
jgi:hypothetical protein